MLRALCRSLGCVRLIARHQDLNRLGAVAAVVVGTHVAPTAASAGACCRVGHLAAEGVHALLLLERADRRDLEG